MPRWISRDPIREDVGSTLGTTWRCTEVVSSTLFQGRARWADTLVPLGFTPFKALGAYENNLKGGMFADVGSMANPFDPTAKIKMIKVVSETLNIFTSTSKAKKTTDKLKTSIENGKDIIENSNKVAEKANKKVNNLVDAGRTIAPLTDAQKKLYRRVSYRKGTREAVWERSKSPDGKVYDPSGVEIKPGEPWEMGTSQATNFLNVSAGQLVKDRRGKIGWITKSTPTFIALNFLDLTEVTSLKILGMTFYNHHENI